MVKLFCQAVQGELSGKGIMITIQTPQGSVRMSEGNLFCFPDNSSSISYWSVWGAGLTVQFHGSPNTYYTYKGVPAILVTALIFAESIGSFIATEIKGKYECAKTEIDLVAV